jgi:RNA polymerase sigma factor (sigma-70 family)
MKTSIHTTDTELVKMFQQGQSQALEILVNRYKDKIFTSIKFILKDTFLSEDIFQEVFIKIIDNLRANKYNEEGKFLPWALRIAHNLCIDHLRKVKRKPSVIMHGDHDVFEYLNFSDDTADTPMIKQQSHSLVRDVIDQLPLEQKEVVVLRHFGDLSFKEIAAMTNTSINTCLGRMRYGLLNMKKIIEQRQLAV